MSRVSVRDSFEPVCISLTSNFFPLGIVNSQNGIFQYAVSIVPGDLPPSKNRRIFHLWQKEVDFVELLERNEESPRLGSREPDQAELQLARCVYDGRYSMYSPTLLDLGPEEMKTFTLEYHEEDEFPSPEHPTDRDLERSPRLVEMTLTAIGMISFAGLDSFLAGQGNGGDVEVLEALAALDVVLKHCPSLNFTTFGRCFYTPDQSVPIANGLTLWQGFHQSLQPCKMGLLLNVDVSATAFYDSGPVVDLVSRILNKASPWDIRGPLSEKERHRVEKFLRGVKVVVIRRKYKISGLSPQTPSNTFFPTNDNPDELKSVSQYFVEKYQLPLQFPYFPCLVLGSNPDRRQYLPMELCHVVPGQRFVRKLNEKQ
ncbi:hypothetical protein HDU91_006071, partial [Kappamyces sp. JEL0680]